MAEPNPAHKNPAPFSAAAIIISAVWLNNSSNQRMDGGQKVWAPHPVEGYQLGQIVDVGADTLTVAPFNSPDQVPTS